MATIAIVGMGPLLGLGIARRFGREDFKVAMVARRPQALKDFETLLAGEGIEAAGGGSNSNDRRLRVKRHCNLQAMF